MRGVVWCGGGERSESGERGAKAEMVRACVERAMVRAWSSNLPTSFRLYVDFL